MSLDLNSTQSVRYMQVYEYYKNLITTGRLPENTKMPSIRKCAIQLNLSRTTIETAYLCLAADGYIISRPQSGYYVTKRLSKPATIQNISKNTSDKTQNKVLYDFTSSNADADSFDFNLWRRYIKNTLRHEKRMLTYGEAQGEYELREAICKYVMNKRNAVCRPENIVIGAGSQALMNILCPLIKDLNGVCFYDTNFAQGMIIFEDYDFEIKKDRNQAQILYMTPSHMTSYDDVMSVGKRLSLLKESSMQNQLIIEDDYDNEFRYFNKPIPCLQGLAGGENVVYLSTFSKLLLPSIRLSFMILPDELLEKYLSKKSLYNQTASKSEQLALCQFLRDGHLESQIRKLKRLYYNKAKLLSNLLEQSFGDKALVSMGSSVFLVHLKIKCSLTGQQLKEKLKNKGILVFSPITCKTDNYAHITLSCCEISINEMPDAVNLIKEVSLNEY